MKPETESRIACQNKLNFFVVNHSDGKYQMPVLKRQLFCPDHLLDFPSALKSSDHNAGVHFFVDDYRFERLWRAPSRYIPILGKFTAVLTPDFSIMQDMPIAMQLWNVFRSRLIGYAMQQAGISIIPSISWSDESSFDFCFDGIECGGTVAVSSVGVIKNRRAKTLFQRGLEEMLRRIAPSRLLFYGTSLPFEHGDVEIIYFDSTSAAWKKSADM